MKNLSLYYRPSCPYCLKVLSFMKEKDLSVELKNISDSADFESELIATGGKRQVPCLFVDSKAIYESDDIIEWMKSNLL